MSSQRPIFSVFRKNKTINYCHVTHFIRFYWSYNIKVVEIGYPAKSKQLISNPGRVITVFLILCKLGLSHALTCMVATSPYLNTMKPTSFLGSPLFLPRESYGTGKRRHIVAHDVSWATQTGKHLLRTQDVSEQNQ